MTQTWHAAPRRPAPPRPTGVRDPVLAASRRGPPAPLRRVPPSHGRARDRPRAGERRPSDAGTRWPTAIDRPRVEPARCASASPPGRCATAWLAAVLLLSRCCRSSCRRSAAGCPLCWRWPRSPRSSAVALAYRAAPSPPASSPWPPRWPACGWSPPAPLLVGPHRARSASSSRCCSSCPAPVAARLAAARAWPWPPWCSWPARPGWIRPSSPASSGSVWARRRRAAGRLPPGPRRRRHRPGRRRARPAHSPCVVAVAALALTVARRDTVAYRRTA